MKRIPNENLAAPAACIVCDDVVGDVVDTERYKNDVLRGLLAVFVCERCVRELAKVFDLVDAAEIAAVVAERDAQAEELANVKVRVGELAKYIGDFVEHPGAGSAVAPVTVEAVVADDSPAAEAAKPAKAKAKAAE